MMMNDKKRCLAVLLLAAVALQAAVLGVEALGCSGETTCEACLMQTPMRFGSERYCKFCPAARIGRRYPEDSDFRDQSKPEWAAEHGPCWDVQSTNVLARDHTGASSGGCTIGPQEFGGIARKGWVQGGKAMSAQEAKAACDKLRANVRWQSAPASGQGASLATRDPQRLQKDFVAYAALERIEDDMLRLLRLYAVDPRFVAKSVNPQLFRKLGQMSARLIIDGGKFALGQAGLDGVVYALDAAEIGWGQSAAYREASTPLMKQGGDATSHAYGDVTYEQLWRSMTHFADDTYERRFIAARQQGKMDDAMREALKLARERLDGKGAAAVGAKVDEATDHVGWKLAKTGVHVTAAALTAGASLVVSGIYESVEYGAKKVGGMARGWSTMDTLDVLSAGVLSVDMMASGLTLSPHSTVGNPQDFARSKAMCDVTSEEKNHGCSKGFYCKREFAFFPLAADKYRKRPFSPRGHCAPKTKVQLENGMSCQLHNECRSGHCAIRALELTVTQQDGTNVTTRFGANNLAMRPDMEWTTPFSREPLTVQQRAQALIGVCMTVLPRNHPDAAACRVVSPQHRFVECPNRPLSFRRGDALPQRPKLTHHKSAPPEAVFQHNGALEPLGAPNTNHGSMISG